MPRGADRLSRAVALTVLLGLSVGSLGVSSAAAKPAASAFKNSDRGGVPAAVRSPRNARLMVASSLHGWFNPSQDWYYTGPLAPKVGCKKAGTRRFQCKFTFMPGNTIYRGKAFVWKVRKRGHGEEAHLRARVVARGTSLRLPPAKRFVRRKVATLKL